MSLAVAAGLHGGAEQALAACPPNTPTVTCDTNTPNPADTRVGNGNDINVIINPGAGIDVQDGTGAIWTSSPGPTTNRITNNGSVAASGGTTAAIRIGAGAQHVNNGMITGMGVVAIERSAAATGVGGFTNSGTGIIKAKDVANAVVDLGTGTFTLNNAGTISGGISMGPGIDNLNLDPGSVITGAIDGGTGSDALTLRGPGEGRLTSPVSGFETLTVSGGRWIAQSTVTGVTTPSITPGATLVLTTGSNISGVMFIQSGGTLETDAANFPASTINNEGLVRFAQPTDATFSRELVGPGAVEKTGPGTLVLTGVNTYRGGTTVRQGTLAVSADSALGDVVSGLTLNGGTLQYRGAFGLAAGRALTMGSSGGTIDTNGFNAGIGGAIGGPGSLTKTGAGVLTLSGSNSYAGGTTVNAGTLAAGTNGALGAASTALTLNGGTFRYLGSFGLDRPVSLGASGGTIDTNGFGNTIASIISGPGQLTKTGAGELRLTGTNSYSGGTQVNAGVLAAGTNAALGNPAGALTLDGGTFRYLGQFGLDRPVSLGAGGGAIDTNGFDNTIASSIGGSGGLTKAGSGTLTLTGNNAYSGGTTITQGALQVGDGGSSGAITGNVVNNGSLVFNRSDAVSFGGVISGTGSVTQAGIGVLTLTADNSYTGGTFVNAGVVAAGTNAALGDPAGALTLDGGTFRYLGQFGLDRPVSLGAGGGAIDTNGFDNTIASSIGGSGALTKAGSGTLTLTGNNAYSGGTTITQGALQIGNGGTSGAITGNVVNNGSLVFNRSDAVSFGGVISGTGSVTQAGTGVLTLTADNSYTGGTFVNAGVLAAGKNAALGNPSGALTLDGGTFRYLGQFGLDRPVSLGAGGGAIDTNGFDNTIASSIGGSGGLTKAGNGTLTLTGNNAYSGGTTITQGALQVGDGGTSGAITGNVVNNGSLVFNRSDAVSFGGVISGTGSVTQAGTGVLTLTADNSYTGGTFVNAGVLAAGKNAALGDPAGALTLDGGTFRYLGQFGLDRPVSLGAGGGTIDTNGFDNTIASSIGGSGGLTKTGDGTLALSAVQSYAGTTRVREGTLAIGRPDGTPGGLAGGGALLIDVGASFGGYGTVAGPVTNNGSIFVADALAAFTGGPRGTLEMAQGLLNGGSVDLRGQLPGNRLLVRGGYVGANGLIDISTVLAGDGAPSDQLVLDGGSATGRTALRVSNAGGLGAVTVANGIRVVDAVNGAVTEPDAFGLAGPVLAGPYRYSLYRGGKGGSDPQDWFLRSQGSDPPDPPDPPIPPDPPSPDYREETAIYATLPGQALTYGRNLVGTLHERMGDSATGLQPGRRDGRGWSRVFGFAGEENGRWGEKSTDNPNYDYALFGFEAGGDVYSAVTAGGTRQAAGLSAAFGGMGSEVSTRRGIEAGDTRLAAFTGGGYWTSLGAGGWYVDARGLASFYDMHADSHQAVQFDTWGAGLTGSLEAGYPLAIAEGLVLEPQLQAVGQSLWLSEADDGHADVSFSDATSLATRAGLRLAYTRAGAEGFGVTVWARGDIWHDWLTGDGEAHFSSHDGPVSFQSGTDDTWLALRVGASALKREDVQLHGSIGAERSLDGEGFGIDARLGAVFSF